MTEQQQVDAGKRVEAFLADEAVKGALVGLEKRYFAEFRDSKTPAEREAIHGRLTALQDLVASTLGLVHDGKVSQRTLEQKSRLEEQQRQRKAR